MRLLFLLLFLCGYLTAQSGFTDVTATANLRETGVARGVSVCDYNADGRPDIYVAIRNGDNLLYRNEGQMVFTEVAREVGLHAAGPSSFSLWADFDNDGVREVVIGNRQTAPRLYRYDGGVFVDNTASSGLAQMAPYLISGVTFDYDNDGLLDLYFSCLSCPNLLFRNEGNLRFARVGGNAGATQTGLAMGTVALDYDRDGDQDLYLVHDSNQPNTLYRNDGGFFTDVSAASGTDITGDGMGVDVHDYDGDGWPDIYVSNLFENVLLRNNGDGTFSDRGFDSRTNDLGMGWGTAWTDYDDDGWPDLFVANETNFTVNGQRYPNLLYRNQGNGTFTQLTAPDDPLASSFSGFGAAVADFDGDGREDIVVANSGNGPTELFRNENTPVGNWIGVQLIGTRSNRDGIGSRVTVHAGDRTFERQARVGGSFASQHSSVLRFGLGDRQVDSVTVHWPAGGRSVHAATAGTVVTLTEPLSVATRDVRFETLRLYPNPGSDRFRLNGSVRGLRVFDRLGRPVLTLDGPVTDFVLPRSLPAGSYTVVSGNPARVGRLQLLR